MGVFDDIKKTIAGTRVSDEVAEARMSICKSCEHIFKPTLSCTKCGCFMKVKTILTAARCPVGKW